MNKGQKKFHAELREMGCCVSKFIFGIEGTPADIHHIVEGGKRLGEWHVIPLCPMIHRQGTAEYPSIHSVNGKHGGRAAFAEAYGVDEYQLLEMCEAWLDMPIRDDSE